MKKLILIWCLAILAACNNTKTKMAEQAKPQEEPDTTFISVEYIKGKVWTNAFMSNRDGRTMLQSFINDTVVKYYFGDAPSCWDENYTFWEKYYDCYKIYADTIEYIAKLSPQPKNDNKYSLSLFNWSRTYFKYKLYVENNLIDGTPDTVLLLNNGEGNGYDKYVTLTRVIKEKRITYPILINK